MVMNIPKIMQVWVAVKIWFGSKAKATKSAISALNPNSMNLNFHRGWIFKNKTIVDTTNAITNIFFSNTSQEGSANARTARTIKNPAVSLHFLINLCLGVKSKNFCM